MTMQGIGVWLNPNTMAHVKVVKHELSIASLSVQDTLSVPDYIRQEIAKYNPSVSPDAVRILGLDAGLVRLRDNGSEVVAQFAVDRGRVRNVLWSIYLLCQKIPSYRNAWQIRINNIRTNDSATLSMQQFEQKLQDNDPILLKEDIDMDGDATDLTFSDYLENSIKRLDK